MQHQAKITPQGPLSRRLAAQTRWKNIACNPLYGLVSLALTDARLLEPSQRVKGGTLATEPSWQINPPLVNRMIVQVKIEAS
eukprot:SAG25_NODE_1540_length_2822_cov_1.731546_4_plen_82_part_00